MTCSSATLNCIIIEVCRAASCRLSARHILKKALLTKINLIIYKVRHTFFHFFGLLKPVLSCGLFQLENLEKASIFPLMYGWIGNAIRQQKIICKQILKQREISTYEVNWSFVNLLPSLYTITCLYLGQDMLSTNWKA